MDKARHIQAIHQQIVQFIQQPTYENLNQAKQIRDMLEKAAVRFLFLCISQTIFTKLESFTSNE